MKTIPAIALEGSKEQVMRQAIGARRFGYMALVAAALGQACGGGSMGSERYVDSGSYADSGAVPDAHQQQEGASATASGPLGDSCGSPCNGTFCQSGGTRVNAICGVSRLSTPCIGTATGLYCTAPCSSDADCSPSSRPMKCLTECAKFPNVANLCWSQSDYDFMVGRVCGSAAQGSDAGRTGNTQDAGTPNDYTVAACPGVPLKPIAPSAPSCSGLCGGGHCFPAATLDYSNHLVLQDCPDDGTGTPGKCVPDRVEEVGGRFQARNCALPPTSPFGGVAGACIPTCLLPSVAGQGIASIFPPGGDTCGASETCVPCTLPFGADSGVSHFCDDRCSGGGDGGGSDAASTGADGAEIDGAVPDAGGGRDGADQ